jgi:hypothetical protein
MRGLLIGRRADVTTKTGALLRYQSNTGSHHPCCGQEPHRGSDGEVITPHFELLWLPGRKILFRLQAPLLDFIDGETVQDQRALDPIKVFLKINPKTVL